MNQTPEKTAAAIARLIVENSTLQTALVAVASTLTAAQQQAARRRMATLQVAQETVSERLAMPEAIELQQQSMERLFQALQRAQTKWPNPALD